MPRPKKPRTSQPPGTPPNSLTASATRATPEGRGLPKHINTSPWQDEVWRFLDITGELAFGARYIANAISRVTLVVDLPNEAGSGRVDVTDPKDPAVSIMRDLFDGEAGQPQMMGQLGLHMFVPGESWLLGVYDPPPGVDPWRVLARQELRQQGTRYIVDRGDGRPEEYESAGSFAECVAIRIWRPHPARWAEATSPCRAVIPILSELEGLTKHVAASIDSRLAGAGVFVVPSEASFGSPPPVPGMPGADAPADDPRMDPLLVDLMTSMITPISDRGDASAVVPLLLKAPGAYLKEIRHISFSTPLSAEARELRAEAIRRLGMGLDIDPSVLLGQAESNHWTGWLVGEDTIRIHVEPPVELICNALLTQYLWAALEAEGHPNPRAYGLHGDTSALRQRPDKSGNAMTLHSMGRLSDEALLRETGFDTGDLPDSIQITRQLLEKLVTATDPSMTQAALQALGVALQPPATPVSSNPSMASPAVGELPPGPSAPKPPAPPTPSAGAQTSPRNPPALAASAVLASSTLLIGRAVERANNRLNGRGKKRGPIQDTDAIEEALRDAWGAVPDTAELLGVDPGALQERLAAYTVRLLSTGQEHSPEALARLLAPLTRDPAA